jgi:hypothetical protein
LQYTESHPPGEGFFLPEWEGLFARYFRLQERRQLLEYLLRFMQSKTESVEVREAAAVAIVALCCVPDNVLVPDKWGYCARVAEVSEFRADLREIASGLSWQYRVPARDHAQILEILFGVLGGKDPKPGFFSTGPAAPPTATDEGAKGKGKGVGAVQTTYGKSVPADFPKGWKTSYEVGKPGKPGPSWISKRVTDGSLEAVRRGNNVFVRRRDVKALWKIRQRRRTGK